MSTAAAGRAHALPAYGPRGVDTPLLFRYYLVDVSGAVVGAHTSETKLSPGDLVAPCHTADAPPWSVTNVLGHAATVRPARAAR